MPVTVVNLQKKIRLDAKPLREFVERLRSFGSEAEGKDYAVALVSDKRMTELNKFFRGKDSTTDVLSFRHENDKFLSVPPAEAGGAVGSVEKGLPNEASTTPSAEAAATPHIQEGSFLGDIVISAEQAQRQAEENGLTLENEIQQLILHGLLHLCGYDHESDQGEMNARELELRDNLGI